MEIAPSLLAEWRTDWSCWRNKKTVECITNQTSWNNKVIYWLVLGHRKISIENGQDWASHLRIASPFKWPFKNVKWDRNECLRQIKKTGANISWFCVLFFLFFRSVSWLFQIVYVFFWSFSLCLHRNRSATTFLRSPFVHSYKIECYKMVDRPTF